MRATASPPARWLVVSCLASCGLTMADRAGAQVRRCDATVAVARGDIYQYKLRGDRCEGTYRPAYASTSSPLRVISLTEAVENYSLTSGESLLVRWSAGLQDTLHLQATAFKAPVHYRMHTDVPPHRHEYVWPTDVLSGIRIDGTRLGLIGSTVLDSEDGQVEALVPVEIRQGGKQTLQGSRRLVVIPGRLFDRLTVKLYIAAPRRTIVLEGAGPRLYQRDVAVELTFPSNLPRGLHRLEFSAEHQGQPYTHTQYVLLP